MNRLLLIMLLIGIGVYLYTVLFKNSNSFFKTQSQPEEEFINDEFIEQPLPTSPRPDRHVHFSEKNTEHIIPNKEEVKQNTIYDDIFIVDPIEIKNTNLTLSENEYFNN